MKKIIISLVVLLGLTQKIKSQVITAVPCDMLGMSVNVGSSQTQLFHELKNINGNQKIDVSFLPSGLYLINLKNNKGNKTIRIIKQ